MKVLKAYKFRIYPTEEQKLFFIRNFGCARFTYNYLLTDLQKQYHEQGEISYHLTPAKLKREYPFLKEADSLALANAQMNLTRAFKNFYQGRSSFPRLKRKKSLWQSYTTNNQHGTIAFIDDYRLKLPKLKSGILVERHREVKGVIRSATISSRQHELFYVSLLCEEEIRPLPQTKAAVGITFSATHCVDSSQLLATEIISLTELEQKLERSERGLEVKSISARRRHVKLEDCQNYQKQKKQLLRLFDSYYHKKKDYIEKLSYELVKSFDYIFIEEEPEAAADGLFDHRDWRSFIRKLRYKAEWYGKQTISVELPQDVPEKNRSTAVEENGLKLI